MTAFTISDDAASSGGGLSVNALALGGDSKLLFELAGNNADGLLIVDRKMRIKKDDFLAKTKIAISVLPATDVTGSLKVHRGNTIAAQFDFIIPPSGQIPQVAPTALIVSDNTATTIKDATKAWEIAASRVDSSGSTPLPSSGLPRIWLGDGKSVYTYHYDMEISETPANNIKTPPNREVQIVGYDPITDKEMSPLHITLTPALGPFIGGDITNSVNLGTGSSGNLPVGTVIQVIPVLKFPDGRLITAGTQKSVTVTESGGVSISAPYNATAAIQGQEVGTNGKTIIRRCQYGVLYKLSTHAGWTYMAGTSQFVNINNTFPDGGLPMPPATTTFTGYAGLTLYGKISPRPNIPDWETRVKYKVFALKSGQWRYVYGPGTVEDSSQGYPYWPYPVYSSRGWDGNWPDSFTMYLDTQYSDVPNTELRYGLGSPRGDQFYSAGEKIGIDISVPSRFGATNLRLYARPLISVNPDTGSDGTYQTGWQLIYDGPYVPTYRWLGPIINSTPTIPVTNTTATYATLTGQVAWPSADPTEILVEPGDSLIAKVGTSIVSTTKVQLGVPIEFLD